MARTKGAKNKKRKRDEQSNKCYPVRLYLDLQEWVDSKPNKNEYFNSIVRKDMEESNRKEEQL